MTARAICALVLATVCVASRSAFAAETWPQFRGPAVKGIRVAPRTCRSPGARTKTSAGKHPSPGLGWSSPVVVGRQIWLTTAIEGEGSLRAVCVDRETGEILHDVEVFRNRRPGPHRRQEQSRVANARPRWPQRVRSLRRTWHGLPDHRRPDRLEPPAQVRPSARPWRIAGHLERFADCRLRWPRRAVHDRPRQADWRGPLEGRTPGRASLFDADP